MPPAAQEIEGDHAKTHQEPLLQELIITPVSKDEIAPTIFSADNYVPRTWTEYFVGSFRKVFNFYWNSFVLCILTGAVGLSLTLTSVKVLSKRESIFQVTFVRGLASAIVLRIMCWKDGVPFTAPQKQPLVFWRGICGAVSTAFIGFAAFKLPLSEASFMTNNYPVVTALLSWIMGMEHLGILSWSGIVGCLAGNALMARPPFLFGGDSNYDVDRGVGILSAFISNVLMAIAIIILRFIGHSIDCRVVTASMHIWTAVVCIPFLIMGYPMKLNFSFSLLTITCYALNVLAGVLGQLAQSRAFQIGPPTKATALMMSNMGLSAIIGAIALNEKVPMTSVMSAGVIVISVIVVIMQRTKVASKNEMTRPLLLSPSIASYS